MDFESYMSSPTPNGDLICHYTTFSTAIEHILHDGKLKFTPLRASHDPLEFEDLDYSSYTYASGDKKVVLDALDKLTKRGDRENHIVKQCIKIACFCIDGTDLEEHPHHKGFNRSRMWIQYAAAHTGICLVFDRQALVQMIRNQINPDDMIFSGRIEYKNKLTELAAAVSLSQADGVATEEERIRLHAKHFLFTKLKDFQNENEYRVGFWKKGKSEATGYELMDIRDAIRGILLGSSFPEVYEPLIELQARDLPIYSAFWLHGTPIWVDFKQRKEVLK